MPVRVTAGWDTTGRGGWKVPRASTTQAGEVRIPVHDVDDGKGPFRLTIVLSPDQCALMLLYLAGRLRIMGKDRPFFTINIVR